MAQPSRLDSLILCSRDDRVLVIPTSGSKTHCLSISKQNSDIVLEPYDVSLMGGASKKENIHGLLGMIEVPLGKVLVVVTRKTKVGDIHGHSYWRIESTRLVPILFRSAKSSLELKAYQRCLQMMSSVLQTPYFYFSYSADVSNSRQRWWSLQNQAEDARTSLTRTWEKMDKRFLWNEFLLQPFLSSAGQDMGHLEEVHKFLLPVIHGALFIHRCSINERPFLWALISRRSKLRTGTRFFARGADARGQVANYVETEQLVECQQGLASYVQTRGSIPIFWAQTSNLKYKPKPIFKDDIKTNHTVFRRHFAEQLELYGDQVVVNLIDQKHSEGKLEKFFSQLFNESPRLDNVHYEAFDFHKECSKMRYERLSLLMDTLSRYQMSYFLEINGSQQSRQRGVFRTNCMDCLDRTNVVQSLLAADNLRKVLHQMGIIPSPSASHMETDPSFQAVYRTTWSDHANLISVQYAGTGALKTDFTRTGVRTFMGMLEDGWNSGIRYCLNNFRDGFRMDSMHFFLNDLKADDVVESVDEMEKRKHSQSSLNTYLPQVMVAFLAFLALVLIFSGESSINMLTVCFLILAVILTCGYVMLQNHAQFVDLPHAERKKLRP